MCDRSSGRWWWHLVGAAGRDVGRRGAEVEVVATGRGPRRQREWGPPRRKEEGFVGEISLCQPADNTTHINRPLRTPRVVVGPAQPYLLSETGEPSVDPSSLTSRFLPRLISAPPHHGRVVPKLMPQTVRVSSMDVLSPSHCPKAMRLFAMDALSPSHCPKPVRLSTMAVLWCCETTLAGGSQCSDKAFKCC